MRKMDAGSAIYHELANPRKEVMATRAAELKLRAGKRLLVTTRLCEAVGAAS